MSDVSARASTWRPRRIRPPWAAIACKTNPVCRSSHDQPGLARQRLQRRQAAGDGLRFGPAGGGHRVDGQEIHFLGGNEAIARQRRRTGQEPQRQALANAVLVQLEPGANPELVASEIHRWLGLTAYSRAQMKAAMVGKLIEASARQIGLFLVILTVVTTTMIGFVDQSGSVPSLRMAR